MVSAQHVVLRYLGHSAWLWTGPRGTRVLIDPYDNHPSWNRRWFSAPCPLTEADIVLVTHDHFDHNAVARVTGRPLVLRAADELHRDEFLIHGVRDRHATPDDMPNVVFVVEVGGVRFCHLGDNRADLPGEAIDAIGSVDVLFVSVDGSSHLLRFWEVDHLIGTIAPRVVVPVHYLIPGVTDPASTLLPADAWLQTQASVRRLETDTMDLHPAALPEEREVWVFEASGR